MQELFPGQNEDEKIYIAVREHPIILAAKVLVWLLFVFILIGFKKFAPDAAPYLFEGDASYVTSVFMQAYTMFLGLSIFIIFVLYYLNMHIITQIRIVDIDQEGLFRHTVSTLNISQIEDVTSDTTGIFGTLFDYGTVYIQTAGAVERFEMDNVPKPAQLTKIIIDLFEENQGKKLHGH